MISYLRLVDFELKRFFKIYIALIGITILSQIIGVFTISNYYLDQANSEMARNHLSIAQFIEMNGTYSMQHIINSGWFVLPIGLSAAALVFYCFLIWYRDWFGKNTFIYRLLMLPTSRMNIYFAKASAIFLMVLGLVGIQLILLLIENMIFQWIIPFDLRTDMTIKELTYGPYGYLGILLPNTFVQFFIHYGIGIMNVFILFTVILFERSYRLKGIAFGALYYVFAHVFFLFPILLEIIYEFGYLYPEEIFILEVILGFIVVGVSIWISRYLLSRKVTV